MAKVMVLEDDRTMVRLLQTLLELEGHQVVRANPPATVLGSIQSEKPDVILMDVFMADLDGLEVLRDIRAHEEVSGIPVIMTSGMDLSAECEATGADGFLLKPYNPEKLLALLTEHIGGRGQDLPA